MQDVVRVATSDPGHRSLIAQQGVDPPRVGPFEDQLGDAGEQGGRGLVGRVGGGVRQTHRSDGVRHLAGDAQDLAARRQDANIGAALQDRRGELADLRSKMLAVVQDEEQVARRQVLRQHRGDRPLSGRAQAKRRRHRLRHERRLDQRLSEAEARRIADRHRESIFRIFKRLHGRDEYGGGTGAAHAYYTETQIINVRVDNDGRPDFASNPFNGPIPTYEQVVARGLVRSLFLALPSDHPVIPFAHQASVGQMARFLPQRWQLFAAIGALAIFIGIFFWVIRFFAYVQPFPAYLKLVTPFLRLNISYKRIKKTTATEMRYLFSFKSMSGWVQDIFSPLAKNTALVIDLNGYPISPVLLRFFLSRFFFKDRTPHLVILVKDWMRFSSELDSMRSGIDTEARPQKRSRDSLLSRLPQK